MRKPVKFVLAVLGLFIAIGIIGAIAGGNEPEPVPEAEKRLIEPTAILDTPEPDYTPIVATPRPTRELQSALADCPTEAEQAYFNEVAANTGMMGRATQDMTQLFSLAGETPALLLNNQWKLQVAAQFAVLQVGSDALYELKAPTERTKPLQESVAALALTTYLAIEAFTAGIDNVDGSKILEGNDLLARASEYAQSFVKQVETLCG